MRLTRILVASTLVLSVAAAGAAQASAQQPSKTTPCAKRLISAHEGYTAHTDGDTVASQKAAFNIGANIADSDVWATKDGFIAEMHDEDVSYSTNGTGLIDQMLLNQVLALRTKYHHEPIPVLDDSLAIPAAHATGRYLMFETKSSFENKTYLSTLADEIAAAGMTDHVIIYSAYLDQLKTLKQIDPDLTVWFKAEGSVPSLQQVGDLNGVMIPAGLLTQSVVDEFHGAGLTVIRERINLETQQAWQHFVATGADGLMSQHPRTVIAYCKTLP